MRFIPLVVSVLLFSFAANAGAAEGPVAGFSVDTEVATSGFYRLTWQSEDTQPVELEEATDADFTDARSRYTGTDSAYFVSGKPDGVYYYRIRPQGGGNPSSWSGPVQVEVRHHPLVRAWMFFGLGAFIFLATVWLVLRRQGGDR